MRTAILSIRIRKDLREKMGKLREIDWRREIEKFIEQKIKEVELENTLKTISEALKDVPVSREPAWRTIREFREKRP